MEISILSRKREGIARLVGTGRDPQARIAVGEVALIRRRHPLYQEFTANGYAEEITVQKHAEQAVGSLGAADR